MNKRQQILLLLILSGVLFFLRLGSISVYQVAEARNAQCAREMMDRKDWVVPVFNGQLRTDKPALEYFAMMTAYTFFGTSEGSARFFSAVCGVLLVLFTFLLAWKHLGHRAAWWTALSLLASAHTVAQFRLATPDPYLILCHAGALYCFMEGWGIPDRRRAWTWYLGMYVALGLALLAKGPVGLALPALTVGLFLLAKKRLTWSSIRQLQPWWGLLVALVVAAPWYLLVHDRTGGAWTRGFFLEHNVERFSAATGGHGGLFFLPVVFVLAGMLPFSAFGVHSVAHAWKRRRENDLLLLSLLATAVVLVFYALARTKLVNYTVPAYPFVALMIGAFLDRLTTEPYRARALSFSWGLLLALALGLPVAFWWWSGSLEALAPYRWLTVCMCVFPLGTVLAALYGRRQRSGALWILAFTYITGIALLFAYPYPLLDAQNPMQKAKPLLYPDRPVLVYRSFNDAFVFYIGHPVNKTADTAAVRDFLSRYPDGLIISDARDQAPLRGMEGLQLLRSDHEIFNSHTSRIYRLRAP